MKPSVPLPALPDLRALFGDVDVYWFDQLLRGRVAPGHRVLDAGCGDGRNVRYLLAAGVAVHGVDADPRAVERARELAARVAPGTPPERFRAEPVEAMSFGDGEFDVVLSSAVLHFARDAAHFRAMLDGTWRVLRPGGLLVARVASRDGQEDVAVPLGDGRWRLGDGSERFLVDAPMLRAETERLGGVLADPLKTVVVHGLRSMSVWVVRRPG